MKFLCPNCKAKYKIAEDKIAGRSHARMKCKKCSFVIDIEQARDGEFQVTGSLPPPAAPKPPAAPRPPTARSGGDAGVSVPKAPPRAPAVPKVSPPKPAPAKVPPPKAAPPQASKPTGSAPSASEPLPTQEVASSALVSNAPSNSPGGFTSEAPTGTGALAGAFQDSLGGGPPSAPESPGGAEWFVGIDNVPVGPLGLDEFRARVVRGHITTETLAWKDGFEDWKPVTEFPELLAPLEEFLGSAVHHPPPAAPIPVEVGSAGYDSEPGFVPKQRSNLPKYIFLGVAACLVGTIGFVLGKENPKPVIQYVEVPAAAKDDEGTSVEEASAKEATPAAAKAEEEKAATGSKPSSKAGSKPKGSSGSKAPPAAEEPAAKGAKGKNLLSGLSGLPAAAGPSSGSNGSTGSTAKGLDSDSVTRTVGRYRTSVSRSCWQPAQAARAANAPSTARVAVTITVAPNGSVQGVKSSGDPKGYRGLSRCITGKVRRWRFPRSGGTTTVNVPFVFAAQ